MRIVEHQLRDQLQSRAERIVASKDRGAQLRRIPNL
jgi:hypothetical protein